ncbi:hypothetical protein EYF80_006468 [Liparis tanakae]|uniref:Uncharacterized protein n=1 Tax=Liparis tanakae TaxID=230148 RepID=A0A4Z2J0E1_9TELE|nr:hypothetical protein EYF80_006468 [Liparis tanakae]
MSMAVSVPVSVTVSVGSSLSAPTSAARAPSAGSTAIPGRYLISKPRHSLDTESQSSRSSGEGDQCSAVQPHNITSHLDQNVSYAQRTNSITSSLVANTIFSPVTCAAIQKLRKRHTDGVVKDTGTTAASPPSYTLSCSWFSCSRCSSAEKVPHHPHPEKSAFVRTAKPECPGTASFRSLSLEKGRSLLTASALFVQRPQGEVERDGRTDG